MTAAGSYDVELTATNDAGEQAKIKTLTINEPTNLSFVICDSTGTSSCQVQRSGSTTTRLTGIILMNPCLACVTDGEGKVLFTNLEPMVYYIWALEEETGGIWVSGGWTPAIRSE